MREIELFIILLLLIAMSMSQAPNVKGILGEKAVHRRLTKLPEEEYRVISDIMLRTRYGTTQIDHVVISVYGIFVIETKNYKGWITGSEYGDYWTKNMYGKKYRFQNPLHQNYGHVKALEETLRLPKDYFIPIVAFSNSSNLKVRTKAPVIYIHELKNVIERYTTPQFRQNDLETIAAKIQSANISSREAKKQHIKKIKTQVAINDAKIQHNLCPKCGGDLVQRSGKFGNFTGCSNYPRCRYTLEK